MRALVTGGARGLGEAIGARLVRDGGAVALLDVSSDVHRTAARLAAAGPGGPVLGFEADVSDEAAVEAAVGEAVGKLDGLDLLVNNAGIGGPILPLVEAPVSALRRVLEVNLLGAMIVARACARIMVRQGGGGAIVNIGSIFGQQGVAEGAAYCASKGGIALLTHSLALELAPHGIRVNTVAPGNMATEMHWEDLRRRAAARGTTLEEEAVRVRGSIPLGRHGTGEDVAAAVAWLASEEASYVTGQTIGVNGGVVLT
ncbi:MAG TPA: SDR family NAD(P)-dependent oxidoreductase [Actinomycetota bacterium]|nr:SDR family NAD(P)-dependent oxidoreductase [Actinomycetota bacterium]